MTTGDNAASLQLERYLDGLITGAERDRLGHLFQMNEDTRAEIERQRRVDDSLQRLFRPPLSYGLIDRVGGHGARRAGRVDGPGSTGTPRRTYPSVLARMKQSRLMALAALFVLVVLAVWRVWPLAFPPQTFDPYSEEWKSMAQIYDEVSRFGFKNFKSDYTVDVFARMIERRFGQPLLFREITGPVRPLGIAYCNTVTASSMCIVTLVSTPCGAFGPSSDIETGVLVFIDRFDQDPTHALPQNDRLNVFTRRVGQLSLYEVTPLEQPAVLDLLHSFSDDRPQG